MISFLDKEQLPHLVSATCKQTPSCKTSHQRKGYGPTKPSEFFPTAQGKKPACPLLGEVKESAGVSCGRRENNWLPHPTPPHPCVVTATFRVDSALSPLGLGSLFKNKKIKKLKKTQGVPVFYNVLF